MPTICPTITAYDLDQYESQLKNIQPFAERIHIDLMDGEFTPNKSPDLGEIWLPENVVSDIHLMYKSPPALIEDLLSLRPNLVVMHFEAEFDHQEFADQLHNAGIKAGLALLQGTTVESAAQVIESFDHVLVFSGNLGEHGGEADLRLLDKVRQIREQFPDKEISWDGGINDQNAKQLVEAGIDILNTGGFIQDSSDASTSYAKLKSVIEG